MYLGAQLYSFDKQYIVNEPDYIFRRLAEIGYQAVEMPFAMDIAPYIKQYNLQYAALHVGCDALNDLSNIIEYLHANDCLNLCVSGPLTWHDRSLNNFQKSCSYLNMKAELLQAAGIKLHYHNHDFEFQRLDDESTPFDTLLQQLDPSLIQLCVDTGWIDIAGQDPISFLNKNKSRISYVHLRDFLNGKSVALGQGSVDVTGIVNALRNNPQLKWMIVEHEQDKSPIEQLSMSRDYLRTDLSL
ncbi:sugar phosphate isomerase/epimerase family protein [Psychromonas antarctica]|uniref:sugar phosphate isomerase/epimerase family protein n=1 Tax=Psychromonas antarctica TaxID=67573 RepID=UPI001EE9014B|nr:TIM barrel protein [Psychromonas antarctica]MCG6201518.1 sugar phosphate isomerase/epimerase [Psychromonas antarctica]